MNDKEIHFTEKRLNQLRYTSLHDCWLSPEELWKLADIAYNVYFSKPSVGSVLVKLDSNCTGEELRLFQLISKWYQLNSLYKDTWCSLFKTKGFHKSKKVEHSICKRIKSIVKDLHPTATTWSVEFLGSKRLIDVQSKRNQKYLVTIQY